MLYPALLSFVLSTYIYLGNAGASIYLCTCTAQIYNNNNIIKEFVYIPIHVTNFF